MKGDFSRYTFDKNKHYNSVLMQQGRVQLDADWNEQQAINRHRTETQGMDVIGPCGAPWDNPGFEITFPENKHLNIGEGRYYIDGILAENESSVVYDKQPDFPEPPDIRKLFGDKATVGLVYLDVWPWHITSLDEPYMREKALGGPDTTTRLKTVWQVKVLPLPSVKINSLDELAELILKRQELQVELRNPPPRLTLRAIENIEKVRLELTKIEYEIMKLVPQPLCGKDFKEWENETALCTGTLNARTVQPPKDERPCLLPPLAGYQRLENQLYRVEVHKGGPRNKATFKWSRDNASVVTEITKIDGKEITVSDVGKDKVLGFAEDQWVEISDDKTELSGQAGQLVQIVDVNSATNVIRLKEPISIDITTHLKLRRWDHVNQTTAPATKDGIGMGTGTEWLPLEGGIEVQFSDGNYKAGDYWLIPARTATGEIEWPPYKVPNTNPIPQGPLGINHHFCRLAIFFMNKRKFYLLEDCRRLFPPVTELTHLFYVSGDGQEAMPGGQLALPLLVGVSRGQWPIEKARVQFTVTKGGGSISPSIATTGPDGIAQCTWRLGNWNYAGTEPPQQEVKAALLDASDSAVHLPVYFNANLSVAREVAYNPAGCDKWDDPRNIKTVEDAINALCMREQPRGCAIAVHDIKTLVAALRESGASANLCLLPGTNYKIDEEVAKDIRRILGDPKKEKSFIKITGCGSAGVIQVECSELLLQGRQIVLEHLCLNVGDEKGTVVLAAGHLTATECAFRRVVGTKETGPLVFVRPKFRLVDKEANSVHWKRNCMESWWDESVHDGFGYWALSAANIPLSGPGRERLKTLSEINPHENEEAYIEAREATIKDIQSISAEKRKAWFDKRPTAKISRLPGAAKAATTKFFTDLVAPRLTLEVLRSNLDAIAYAFYVRRYNIALALELGVGGWIEDNVIDGHLALNYGDEYTPLSWTAEQPEWKQAFVNKYGNKYLQTLPTILRLRGNKLFAAHSNANSIMKIIDGILEGRTPDFHPQACYRSMTVTENIFAANRNSFVCGSLIMNGNQFASAASEKHIAAFVLGYDGILVGNTGSVAADEQALIEKILVETRTQKFANLLQTV